MLAAKGKVLPVRLLQSLPQFGDLLAVLLLEPGDLRREGRDDVVLGIRRGRDRPGAGRWVRRWCSILARSSAFL